STTSPRHGPSTMPPTFEYCLYARYSETPTDPTTAYPTGGDCTTVTCQPTRVREGVTFELRCPASSTPNDVVTRLTACLGRLSSPDRQVGNGRALERASAQMRRALPRIERGVIELTESEKAQWAAAQPELQHIAELQAKN